MYMLAPDAISSISSFSTKIIYPLENNIYFKCVAHVEHPCTLQMGTVSASIACPQQSCETD